MTGGLFSWVQSKNLKNKKKTTSKRSEQLWVEVEVEVWDDEVEKKITMKMIITFINYQNEWFKLFENLGGSCFVVLFLFLIMIIILESYSSFWDIIISGFRFW